MEPTVKTPDRQHSRPSHHLSAGFTLVELLVVLAIIAALAGLLTPAIHYARVKSKRDTTSNLIQQLTLAAESYNGDWGDYPPTTLEGYGVYGNGVNDGIESFLAHVTSRRKGGPYFDYKEDSLANLDEDTLGVGEVRAELDWVFGDDQLREIIDSFGNPLVYVHNADYERAYKICLGDDPARKLTVRAGRSAKTATYHEPTRFQLWSIGPNSESETGAEPPKEGEESDDIGNWK
ncbi:MAG: type II secretion system protein [Planctomycetes bacterium]|nr:type II secretion system protein [Planctomycetota bacterium]